MSYRDAVEAGQKAVEMCQTLLREKAEAQREKHRLTNALHAARAALSRIADPKLQPIYDLIHDAINGDPLPTRFGPQIDQIMRDRQEDKIDVAEAYTRALMVATLADAALGRRDPN